jgi:hypothetical protein
VTTKAEAIRSAGRGFAIARAERDARSPRAAAEAAWYPGHRLTVDGIEALITAQRANAHTPEMHPPLAA